MKNKLKTRSSAQKRYKKTGTGKFIRRKAFKGHILEKKKVLSVNAILIFVNAFQKETVRLLN